MLCWNQISLQLNCCTALVRTKQRKKKVELNKTFQTSQSERTNNASGKKLGKKPLDEMITFRDNVDSINTTDFEYRSRHIAAVIYCKRPSLSANTYTQLQNVKPLIWPQNTKKRFYMRKKRMWYSIEIARSRTWWSLLLWWHTINCVLHTYKEHHTYFFSFSFQASMVMRLVCSRAQRSNNSTISIVLISYLIIVCLTACFPTSICIVYVPRHYLHGNWCRFKIYRLFNGHAHPSHNWKWFIFNHNIY